MTTVYRSGEALMAFGHDLRVDTWNEELESLTGIPASEAIGLPCWEALGGLDERGAMICHPGCSAARLAREGWPIPSRRIAIRTAEGRKLVTMSTIAAVNGNRTAVGLHLFRPTPGAEPEPARVHLTARQQEVIELIAEGRAKVIAARLGIAGSPCAITSARSCSSSGATRSSKRSPRRDGADFSALTLGPVRICPPRLTFGEPIPGKMQGVRLVVVVLATLLLAPAAARAAGGRRSSTTRGGAPKKDGKYLHWNKADRLPPHDLASTFYPSRGPYSSRDWKVLSQHMSEIARAGVDEIISSWWGWAHRRPTGCRPS